MKSLYIIFVLYSAGNAFAAGPMFDPVIDAPDREWCYAAQSTTVIGLPFVPEPVQVTYDGAVYTRHAELAFFYGEPLKPVMARNKTFREGWIPVVEYEWSRAGIDYGLEVFSWALPALGRANLVQFARLTMVNPGPKPAEGVVAAAVRGSAGRFRLGKVKHPVVQDTRFEMAKGRLTRDGRHAYFFSPGAETYAVMGAPCAGSYTAAEHHISDRVATGFSVYRRMLQPGGRFSATFKMPRVPLAHGKPSMDIAAADYNEKLAETVSYWKTLLDDFEVEIPEKRVNDSYRASLVHLILATRDQKGDRRQGSGLPYDALFLNDYFDMLLAYDTAGLAQFTAPNIDWLLRKQHASGMFIDVHNRGNNRFVTSHGQGLFALAYHLIMTRDMDYSRKVWTAIRKGAMFIVNDHKTHNRHGLIRPSIPYDAPMVTGYHTCHNLFALLALRTSIRAARIMGEEEDARAWSDAEATYRRAVLRAVDDVYQREGYIRSGLYDWKAGWVQGREGWGNDYPNQDWENNLLVYPSELLTLDDVRLHRTLGEIRRRKYREGVMSYRNGMHVHQYVTLNQAQQYRAIGSQRKALLDFYHVLLHNGSTHEGFENLVVPWSTRTPAAGCPPPHAWAAAKTALFIRNMLVCEYGGDFGIRERERDLHLFSLISPSWIRAGRRVAIRNAPTEMGPVSSVLAFTADGATLTVKHDFHRPPRYLVFRVPDSVALKAYEVDASKAFEKGGLVYFSPDLTRATFKWRERPDAHVGIFQRILEGYRKEFDFIVKDDNYDPVRAGKPFLLEDERDHPPEPLSFDLIRRAFVKEYGRRFKRYVAGGGKPYTVEPPALLTAEARRLSFEKAFGPAIPAGLKGKATASASLKSYPPWKAIDGNAADLQSSWQADPYPAWLKIDLGQSRVLTGVHVRPYWGGGRFYRYKVEISEDGNTWQLVGDMTANAVPSTPNGDRFTFKPTEARFFRVGMLYHNLNKGVHLVEVAPIFSR